MSGRTWVGTGEFLGLGAGGLPIFADEQGLSEAIEISASIVRAEFSLPGIQRIGPCERCGSQAMGEEFAISGMCGYCLNGPPRS